MIKSSRSQPMKAAKYDNHQTQPSMNEDNRRTKRLISLSLERVRVMYKFTHTTQYTFNECA